MCNIKFWIGQMHKCIFIIKAKTTAAMLMALELKSFAGWNKIAAKSSPDTNVEVQNHRCARLIKQTKSTQFMTGIASINPRKATYCTNTPPIVPYSLPTHPQGTPRHLNCSVQIPNPSALRNPSPPKTPIPAATKP